MVRTRKDAEDAKGRGAPPAARRERNDSKSDDNANAAMPASPHSFFAKSPVPVYALCISQDDVLIYAGGGGQSNSGISNAIVSSQQGVGE